VVCEFPVGVVLRSLYSQKKNIFNFLVLAQPLTVTFADCRNARPFGAKPGGHDGPALMTTRQKDTLVVADAQHPALRRSAATRFHLGPNFLGRESSEAFAVPAQKNAETTEPSSMFLAAAVLRRMSNHAWLMGGGAK
jgi:hypothetical protein